MFCCRSPENDKMASNLTKKQVNLVREIWQTNCGKVEQLTKVGVELFIGIFTAAPALQNEFKFARNKTLKQLETSPRLAIHASNFMNVVGQAVANVEDLSVMTEFLEELGFKHQRFGAQTAHFPVIGSLLISILRKGVSKGKWTNKHEEAWEKFYNEFTVHMIKGLEQAGGNK